MRPLRSHIVFLTLRLQSIRLCHLTGSYGRGNSHFTLFDNIDRQDGSSNHLPSIFRKCCEQFPKITSQMVLVPQVSQHRDHAKNVVTNDTLKGDSPMTKQDATSMWTSCSSYPFDFTTRWYVTWFCNHVKVLRWQPSWAEAHEVKGAVWPPTLREGYQL